MDIDIIDKFISNSITFIQHSIKKSKKVDIINNITKKIDNITDNKNTRLLISQLINISLEIYFLIYNKNKLIAKLSKSDTTPYIYKYYGLFMKFSKLLELKDVKIIFEEIETNNNYYELKPYVKEFGEEKLTMLLTNKQTSNDYLAFMLIYLFIYIRDYRIKIYNEMEKNFLKQQASKKISYFTTNVTKIDYSDILNSLPKDIKYKANDFYDMLYNIVNKRYIQYERKDNYYYLFTKILIPIIDDFQRIHKSGSINKDFSEELSEKRGQTIVKNILSDVRNKQDFYSNKEKINKQLFPSVLEDINGVFYDELLELRILSKLDNKLMINNENIELYNSLENIRKYNYINYNNNPNLLLNYEHTEPVESIRNISIKFFDKTHLQTRMILNGFSGDIIKFGIKHPSISFGEIMVINTDYETKSVTDISQLIEKIILDDKFFQTNKYTLYTYKINNSNKEKIIDILDKLFINYEHILYSQMLKKLNTFNTSFANIYYFNRYLVEHNKQFHKLSTNNYLNSKFELELHDHFKDNIKDDYDEKEDYIPGLFNDLITIPEYKVNKDKELLKIELDSLNEPKQVNIDYDNFTSMYTCQHFISWIELQKNRKNNPNKYNQLLYEFIKKYAIKDSMNMYICKSCKFNLKISVDITESFQVGMANILAINLTTERPLEELREYEKYSSSIKNIDKMVEKIASFYSFNNYIGSSINSKKNRNEITKEVIDFLNIHNNTLRINNFNKRRQREKTAFIEFGIDTEFSNYFLFKLENEIFKFSSNDTDKFKRVKINNIFIVIIFSFYLRLNYNIFVNVSTNDKYCNYFFFEKYGDIIFKELKIISDFTGKKILLNKIPNMKFYLFMMACNMSKYNLWFPNTDTTLNLSTLKSIIHTFIDLYNTIIGVIMKKKKSYIYEYFAGKLLQIQNSVIDKSEYLDSIKNRTSNKIKTDFKNKKINFIKSIIPNVVLDGVIKPIPYKIMEKRYDLSSLFSTNKKQTLPTLNNKFNEQLIIASATKLTKFYDKTGKKIKSSIFNNYNFTYKTALDFINKILLHKKYSTKLSYIPKTSKIIIQDNDINNLNTQILNLSKIIKSKLGGIIIKKNKNIRIDQFKYMLTFNHITVPLKKPIFFSYESTKIINKFNRNLLTLKIGKYIYSFEPNTLNYIGFFEKNKKLIEVKDKSKYLVPEYSLLEKFLFMGISEKKYKYSLDEVNTEIINRYNNISFFIKNFISNINLHKNTTPKLKTVRFFDKSDNYKYIFDEIIINNNHKYKKYQFTENKNYSITELINKSKEINSIYIIFIKSLIKLLNINLGLQTNISEFIIDNVTTNFYRFNDSKYNTQEIKFNLILNSDTIIIGDVDTGIGFYGDVNFVEQISAEDKKIQENEIQDDTYRAEGMDIEQMIDDEEVSEDMGDNDIQLGVGEI
jgi:hypothetical protein